MAVSFVQKDKGGDLSYDAPERWDASPAPTVTLYAPAGGEMVASQSATLGPATTLDDTAASGQTTIPLTATTSIEVGKSYYVGPNGGGQGEWVTVASISSGVSVTARDELQFTYTSTNKFESTELSVTLSADDAGSAYRGCYARWAYSVDTQARLDTTIFNVSIWMPALTVTEQDLMRRDPRAFDLVGGRQRLAEVLEDIWENEILEDLGQSCDPGALLSGDVLRLAVINRVLAEIYFRNQDHEHYALLFDNYRTAWLRVLQQTPIDVDQSGSVSDDDITRPAWTGNLYRG